MCCIALQNQHCRHDTGNLVSYVYFLDGVSCHYHVLCTARISIRHCTAQSSLESAAHAFDSALLAALQTTVSVSESCLHGLCDEVQPLPGSLSVVRARGRLTKAAFLQNFVAKLILWQLDGAIPV